MGRPKLKPRKGWCWRVIICNDVGEVFYDDVNSEHQAPTCVHKLIRDIPEVREHELKKKVAREASRGKRKV